MNLTLQRDAGEAIYRQLYAALRSAILDGAFAPGARLPSTRALADDLGVSRTTVLQAFDLLVGEGYAVVPSTGGTHVARTLPRRARGEPAVRRDQSEPRATPRLSRGAQAMLQELGPPGVPFRPVPFAVGLAAIDEFPVDVWTRIVARQWRTHGREMLGFSHACGYPPLRQAIAQYVMTARGVRCTPEQVVVVNGAQHGVEMIARLLLDPGDAVWVEDPGYAPMRATLRAFGAELVHVPVDEHGMDVAEGERRSPNARMALVTPSYHAPLGVALSLERRLALLDWAARADAWVVEDDWNGEFRYDAESIPAVQGLDRAERVIYVGTFSKILAPGLRVGYLVVPPSLVDVIRRTRRAGDLHTAVPVQAVLAEFLSSGAFARHVRRTRELYRRRQRTLLELAPTATNGLLEVQPAAAGMQVVGLLPPGVSAQAVARAAAARGVQVEPFTDAAPHVTHGRPALLLGYAAFGRDATRTALIALGEAIRDVAPRLESSKSLR